MNPVHRQNERDPLFFFKIELPPEIPEAIKAPQRMIVLAKKRIVNPPIMKIISKYTLSSVVMATIVGSKAVAATTVLWSGAGDGSDFNSDANWGGPSDSAPLSGDTAAYLNSSAPNVALTSDAEVKALVAAGWAQSTTVAVDTGASTLTLEGIDVIGSSGASLTLQGDYNFDPAIGGTARFKITPGSTLTVDGAVFSTADSTATLGIYNGASSGTVLFDGVSIDTFDRVVVQLGQIIEFSNTNTIDSDLGLYTGATLSFDTTGDKLDVSGNLTGTGTWVFDVSPGTDPFIEVVNGLNVDGITLDIPATGFAGAHPSSPVILAEYGTLSGTDFANHSSIPLLPGQRIVYDFNGDTQIAIVPELAYASPLLVALLPLFVARSRRHGTKPLA